MKTANFLVEIQTEELPPKSLLKLAESFREEVATGLEKADLNFKARTCFMTPRRLAVYVEGLQLAQDDKEIERRGPAVKAAFDKDGKPTKACEGFAKSCGVTVSKLKTIKTDQGEWVGLKQKVKGKKTAELLPGIVEHALKQLPIAKRMRWGDRKEEFVRPVHGVVMLLDGKTVKATILGHKTGNKTLGHRFMADKDITIKDAKSYADTLKKKGHVIVDFAERREEVEKLAKKALPKDIQSSAIAFMADDLLDEVTALVEWPVALCGEFDKEFLKVPKEALVSAMQDHQRYFPVGKKNGALLPYFVTISNIKSKKPKSVIHGNERVLRARLADAAFFYEEDQKESLADRVERLKGIVYQAKLGTLHDKAERISKLAGYIAEKLDGNKDQAKRAGLLAKADLTTSMVGEFPELQGTMGRYYAEIEGEPEPVATAIERHYWPRHSGDLLPKDTVSQALALADRIDTLVGIFGIRQMPTGDKDPFGLRRAAIGVLRILIEMQLSLDLKELCDKSVALFGAKIKEADTADMVVAYLLERFRSYYLDRGVTPDVIIAVTALPLTNPLDVSRRIDAVKAFKKLPEAEMLSAANKRVSNILAKYDGKLELKTVNKDAFEHDAERILAEALAAKMKKVDKLSDYQEILKELASLRQPVDTFFDEVMVMAEDKAQRENRLLLLSQLRAMFLRVADIALLQ